MTNSTFIAGIGLVCFATALVGCGQSSSKSDAPTAQTSKDYAEAKEQYKAAGWPWESPIPSQEDFEDMLTPKPPTVGIPEFRRSSSVPLSGPVLRAAAQWVEDQDQAISTLAAAVNVRMTDKTKPKEKISIRTNAETKSVVKALILRAEVRMLQGNNSGMTSDLKSATAITGWQMREAADPIEFMVGLACFENISTLIQNYFPTGKIKKNVLVEIATQLDVPGKIEVLMKDLAVTSIVLARYVEVQTKTAKEIESIKDIPEELTTETGQKNAILRMNSWVKIREILTRRQGEANLIAGDLKPIVEEIRMGFVGDQESLGQQLGFFNDYLELALKAQAKTRVFRAAALFTLSPKGSSLDALPKSDWSDPFTGNPLIVKWNGDKVTVQSVGPNGRDDSAETGKTDDIRYTLARNQAN